jgi:hypothetical protein
MAFKAILDLARREDLSVVELWHEPIAVFHTDFALRLFARYWFVSWGLCSPRLISDHGLRTKAAKRLLQRRDVFRWCAAKGARRYRYRERGHTAVLVAERAP